MSQYSIYGFIIVHVVTVSWFAHTCEVIFHDCAYDSYYNNNNNDNNNDDDNNNDNNNNNNNNKKQQQ